MINTLTFADLVEIEPRLGDLLAEAKAISSDGIPNFCANRVWYGYLNDGKKGLKHKMEDLVGFFAERKDPKLITSSAYDLAYETIYGTLPDCKHPGGLC
jgi:hypothetical protein